MKRSKLLYISLIALVAALLCAVFVFSASANDGAAEDGVLYEVTKQDGTVVKITEPTGISDIFTKYTPKAIKCYTDLDLDHNSTYGYSVDIDLNGNTLKQAGGYVRPKSAVTIKIRNGFIVFNGTKSNVLFNAISGAEIIVPIDIKFLIFNL